MNENSYGIFPIITYINAFRLTTGVIMYENEKCYYKDLFTDKEFDAIMNDFSKWCDEIDGDWAADIDYNFND